MSVVIEHKWLVAVLAVLLVLAFATIAMAQTGTTTPTQGGSSPGSTVPSGAAGGHVCDHASGSAASGGSS